MKDTKDVKHSQGKRSPNTMEEQCAVLLRGLRQLPGSGSAASFKSTLMFQMIINHSEKGRDPSEQRDPLFFRKCGNNPPLE